MTRAHVEVEFGRGGGDEPAGPDGTRPGDEPEEA